MYITKEVRMVWKLCVPKPKYLLIASPMNRLKSCGMGMHAISFSWANLASHMPFISPCDTLSESHTSYLKSLETEDKLISNSLLAIFPDNIFNVFFILNLQTPF